MLVLGLILIILAALALLLVIVGGANDPANMALGSLTVHTSAMWLFISGALTLLVLIVGLDLLRTGLKRARQRRKDAKELNRLSAKLEQTEAEKRRAEEARAAEAGTANTTETPVTETRATENHSHGTPESHDHTREI
jgi:hypothetical protein